MEYWELQQILEKEGMDLLSMVKQWKEVGLEKILEQIEQINFLYLAQAEDQNK